MEDFFAELIKMIPSAPLKPKRKSLIFIANFFWYFCIVGILLSIIAVVSWRFSGAESWRAALFAISYALRPFGIISAFLAIILSAAVLSSLGGKKKKRPIRRDAKVPIRVERGIFWIGLVISVIFAGFFALMRMFLDETDARGLDFMCVLFIAVGVVLVMAYLNIRVILEGDFFIYRNFWRKTRKISYNSVERYKHTTQYIILYVDGKKYRFEKGVLIGIEELLEIIEDMPGIVDS